MLTDRGKMRMDGGENMAYRTIAGYAEDEFVERKSRFIGYIKPVASEEEAQAFIGEISKRHRDATHNVFAYRLRSGVERCSDNGEPQGTAGLPTLDVLQREELVDVCAVVTRYFGGILLGTGGLVRSYAHAAKLAVDAAQIVTMCDCVEAEVVCSYSLYGKLSYMLPDFSIQVRNTDFGENVTLLLRMRKEQFAPFQKELTELSNGQVEAKKTAELFDAMA